MLETLNWNDLRLLMIISRKGSFLGASKELGVAASTISRRISQLEELLGGTVVERDVDGCKLTARGSSLVKIANTIDEELDRELSSSVIKPIKLSGHIKVNSVEGFSPYMSQVIKEFSSAHSECSIDWLISLEPQDISGKEADVSIRTEHLGEATLIYKTIGEIEFGFYCSKKYRETITEKTKPSGVDYIALLPPLSNQAHMLKARELGFINHKLRMSSTGALIESVHSGLGVAVIPKIFSEGLEEVFVDIKLPKLPVYCTTRPQALKQPHIRAFVDFVYIKAQEYSNT